MVVRPVLTSGQTRLASLKTQASDQGRHRRRRRRQRRSHGPHPPRILRDRSAGNPILGLRRGEPSVLLDEFELNNFKQLYVVHSSFIKRYPRWSAYETYVLGLFSTPPR